jgi:hypothetical protein
MKTSDMPAWMTNGKQRTGVHHEHQLTRLAEIAFMLLFIHDLGTRWGERSASRSSRALPPGKGPPVPIVHEAGWAPEPIWTQRLEEKPLVSAEDRTSIARSSP